MKQAVRNYLVFLWRSGRLAFAGDWRYYLWMGVLTFFCLLGLNAYLKQFVHEVYHLISALGYGLDAADERAVEFGFILKEEFAVPSDN